MQKEKGTANLAKSAREAKFAIQQTKGIEQRTLKKRRTKLRSEAGSVDQSHEAELKDQQRKNDK